MTHHTHRAVESLSRTVGWSYCVAKPGSSCSGAAHGGVLRVDRCSCGATRKTESNGRHAQRGPWAAPELTERREVEVAGVRYYVTEDCSVLTWYGPAGHYCRSDISRPAERAAVRAAVTAEVEALRGRSRR